MRIRTKYICNIAAACLLAVCFLSGCAAGRAVSSEPGSYQEGVASWYGKKFHGRPTANGETYDMHDMTAAHRTLPFNTTVEVTSRDTGKRTKVRINDRGPFVKGRIIDLSFAAAKELDMLESGTARVSLRILGKTKGAVPEKFDSDEGFFSVQAGSFSIQENAVDLKEKLGMSFGDVHIVRFKEYYRVRVGKFDTRRNAVKTEKRLISMGYKTFITRD